MDFGHHVRVAVVIDRRVGQRGHQRIVVTVGLHPTCVTAKALLPPGVLLTELNAIGAPGIQAAGKFDRQPLRLPQSRFPLHSNEVWHFCTEKSSIS
jgi:hypothetical protein